MIIGHPYCNLCIDSEGNKWHFIDSNIADDSIADDSIADDSTAEDS